MLLSERHIVEKYNIDSELATYIAEYILEEVERGDYIDTDNIVFMAIDAFEGGAR